MDKLYCIGRYRSSKKLTKKEERKNNIFNMMWASLGHSSAMEKFLHPGNFDKLKHLANLLGAEKNNNSNICNVQTQINLRRDNGAGKQFVGIGALNNISHCISDHSEVKFVKMDKLFIIEGVTTDFWFNDDFKADPSNSPIDNSRISRTLGMFVGAAADNAKEAVLGALNITPVTANYAMAMFRMGVPLNIVAGIMNMPIIKKMSQNTTSFEFEKAIQKMKANNTFKTDQVNITFEDLKAMANGKSNSAVENAVINLLQSITPYVYGYNRLNKITSLNSTKNSVGPTDLDVLQTTQKIDDFLTEYDNIVEGGFASKDSCFTESLIEFYDNVPFLEPLCRCYKNLVPQMCQGWSFLQNPVFEKLLGRLKQIKLPITSFTPERYKQLINAVFLSNITRLMPDINIEELFKETPKEVLRIREDMFNSKKENIFLQSLAVIESFGIGNNALNSHVSLYSKQDKENIAYSWQDLLQVKNNESNKEFTKNLLLYNLFSWGFYWSPVSLNSITTPKVKQSLEFYESIFSDLNGLNIDLVIEQFLRNNTYSRALWPKAEDLKDTDLKLKDSESNIYTVSSDKAKDLPYAFTFNKKFYIKVESNTDFLYKEVTPLGKKNKLLEYDNNKDIKESIIKSVNTSQQNSLETLARRAESESQDTVIGGLYEYIYKEDMQRQIDLNPNKDITRYLEENKEQIDDYIMKVFKNEKAKDKIFEKLKKLCYKGS